MAKKQRKTNNGGGTVLHTTQAELGDAVGLSQSQISRRLRESECPVAVDGPWDADDVTTLRDWLDGDGDTSGGDNLKRANALKAQVLAAKYTLQMLTECGTVGGELFSEFARALEQATMMHWRNTQYKLGDVFRENGGMEAVAADKFAEQFAREYVAEFADRVAEVFTFHNRLNDSLRPIIKHADKVARDLRELGDLDGVMLDRIDEQLAQTKDAIDGR